jgi:hypothetical protein
MRKQALTTKLLKNCITTIYFQVLLVLFYYSSYLLTSRNLSNLLQKYYKFGTEIAFKLKIKTLKINDNVFNITATHYNITIKLC